jgi:hypothetical protein
MNPLTFSSPFREFVDWLLGRRSGAAAFSKKEARASGHAERPVRSAGSEAMRDPPTKWDDVDEASDGSFPASDPPARP